MPLVIIEARLTGIETNPHDHRDPWVAKLYTRDGTTLLPLTAAQALYLGPHIGTTVEIEIRKKQ